MIWIGILIGAVVLIYGVRAIFKVLEATFNPEITDMLDEVDEETEWLRAVQRATERRQP